MTNPTTLTMEQLMTHSGWLRRLAGGLLGDPAAADDAVQDALISAIRRPPDTRGSVRGWFGTVLTNRVRDDARNDRRRRGLAERAAAEVTEAPPTPEEVVERLQLQRLIASLLVELDESYRQVVYMRFFEDLDSSAIAARLGIPAGTVRWRLKMGLDELRARLDQRDGQWRRMLAPLLPASTGGGAAGVGLLGSASGGLFAKVAVGALVVAVLAGAAAVAPRFAGGDRAASLQEGPSRSPGPGLTRPPVFVAAPVSPGSESGPEGPAALAASAPGQESQAQAAGEKGAKVAPFTGVRWRGDVPEVEVGGVWVELLSIDGVAADRIVAFCKERYPRPDGLWRKRFSEDLPEVMTGLGKPPAERVVLECKSLSDGGRRTVTAPMTKENRRRVWERNQAGQPAAAPSMVDRFARVSPFSGLKFRGEAMDVEVAGAWYRLGAVNGVTAERLVAFAKEKFGGRWQKRVAEDPVEVLAAMGVTAGTKVDLVLEELGSKKRVERKDVPLTEENRRRVKEMWDKP